MTIDIALALVLGCILGVIASVTLIGLAFAVRNRQFKSEQEETDKHE